MAIFVYFCKNPGEILKPFPLLKKSEITQHLCVKWSTREICIIMYVVSPLIRNQIWKLLQFIEAKCLVKAIRLMASFTIPFLSLSVEQKGWHWMTCFVHPHTSKVHKLLKTDSSV